MFFWVWLKRAIGRSIVRFRSDPLVPLGFCENRELLSEALERIGTPQEWPHDRHSLLGFLALFVVLSRLADSPPDKATLRVVLGVHLQVKSTYVL